VPARRWSTRGFALLVLGMAAAPPSGACPLERTGGWGGFGSAAGQFNFAHHLAVDPANGNVYVGDLLNHRVQVFDPDGGFLGAWQRQGTDGVAVGPNGRVYVVGNNLVTEHTSTGTELTVWGGGGTTPGSFNFAIDIAVDAQGFVYVADWMNHRVQKFTGTGAFETLWHTSDHGPISVSIAPGGEVYTTDLTANLVEVWSASGDFIRSWGTFGSGEGQFDAPTKVAFDRAGNVVVSDAGNGRVQVFTPTGDFLCTWGSEGSGSEHLLHPTAVGTYQDRVYVMDKDNHRVVRLESPPTSVVPKSWSMVKDGYRATR